MYRPNGIATSERTRTTVTLTEQRGGVQRYVWQPLGAQRPLIEGNPLLKRVTLLVQDEGSDVVRRAASSPSKPSQRSSRLCKAGVFCEAGAFFT